MFALRDTRRGALMLGAERLGGLDAQRLGVSAVLGGLGALLLLGCSWGTLGCSWVLLGGSCCFLGRYDKNICSLRFFHVHLGLILRRLWSVLGGSWAPLSASWYLLVPLGSLFGASWEALGCLLRFINTSKVQFWPYITCFEKVFISQMGA